MVPGRHAAASNSRTDHPTHTVDLIQLRVRAPAPSLGSHHFVLRLRKLPYASTMSCTTPFLALRSWSIQTHPNGSSLGRQCTGASCRTVRRSSGMRSVSELTAERLPHGNPGAWTTEVIREISREFDIAVDNLPGNSLFSWASWKSAGRTSRRPRGHTTVSSPAKRILGTITMGPSSPLSRAASYRITFALSRSRRSFGRTTPTSVPPLAS